MEEERTEVSTGKRYKPVFIALGLLILLILIVPNIKKQVDLEQVVKERYGVTLSSPEWHGLDYVIELIQIVEVREGSCAERMGFMQGDLIFAPYANDLPAFLAYLNQEEGTALRVSIVREADFMPGKDFRDTNQALPLVFSAP
ncbi:MAG: hypothetical protein V3576_01385 [Candidatus Cloacimonadota bacterium]